MKSPRHVLSFLGARALSRCLRGLALVLHGAKLIWNSQTEMKLNEWELLDLSWSSKSKSKAKAKVKVKDCHQSSSTFRVDSRIAFACLDIWFVYDFVIAIIEDSK